MAAKSENLDRPNSSLVIIGMLKGRLLVSLDLFELKTRRNARRRVHLAAFQPLSLMLAPSLCSWRKRVARLSVSIWVSIAVLLVDYLKSRFHPRSDLHPLYHRSVTVLLLSTYYPSNLVTIFPTMVLTQILQIFGIILELSSMCHHYEVGNAVGICSPVRIKLEINFLSGLSIK